jgi:hypothetical protein
VSDPAGLSPEEEESLKRWYLLLDKISSGAIEDSQPLLTEALQGVVGPEAEEIGTNVFESKVAEWVDLFERSAEARVVMRCARRAGIPYGEARARWRSADDIAAELGFDLWENIEAAERCNRCGTRNDEMRAENKRVLPHSKWMLKGESCEMCGMIHRAEKALKDSDREIGYRYKVVPRGPLDPAQEG